MLAGLSKAEIVHSTQRKNLHEEIHLWSIPTDLVTKWVLSASSSGVRWRWSNCFEVWSLPPVSVCINDECPGGEKKKTRFNISVFSRLTVFLQYHTRRTQLSCSQINPNTMICPPLIKSNPIIRKPKTHLFWNYSCIHLAKRKQLPSSVRNYA